MTTNNSGITNFQISLTKLFDAQVVHIYSALFVTGSKRSRWRSDLTWTSKTGSGGRIYHDSRRKKAGSARHYPPRRLLRFKHRTQHPRSFFVDLHSLGQQISSR